MKSQLLPVYWYGCDINNKSGEHFHFVSVTRRMGRLEIGRWIDRQKERFIQREQKNMMINWRRRWMEDQRGWNPLVQCLSPWGHFFPLSKTSDHCSPISFIMDLAIPPRKTFVELWRTLSFPRWETDHIRRWLQLQQKCWIQKGLKLEWRDPWLWNLFKRFCIWWKLGKYAKFVKYAKNAKYRKIMQNM